MNQNSLEVRTKSELKQAMEAGFCTIIVRGELAEKIHQAYGIKKLSKFALVALAAALAAVPFTGGLSGGVALAGISAQTGMAITALTTVAFLGLALIISITKDYDKKFFAKADGVGEASMELNKRKN